MARLKDVMMLSLFLLLSISETRGDLNQEMLNNKASSARLPPCASCRALVESFGLGLSRTSRFKLEGGDAAWEEKNQQKGYARSEVRFVEIQEQLCKDRSRGETQCHDNHHQWEEHLEHWWHHHFDDDQEAEEAEKQLLQWLCVDKLKVCCPEHHFGPNCKPCNVKDDKGQICSGNGKCKGSGTRKGNGQCACDPGYSGVKCNSCSVGYYDALQDKSAPLLCSACHKSCLASCSGPGPKSCLSGCKSGYVLHEELGCTDVDECRGDVCDADKEFCVNTDGAFKCLKCDVACRGCDGDGPDSCRECNKGFVKNGDVCVDEKSNGKVFTLSNTRFFTYLGLCVATVIIFQRSMITASVLGLVIALYISFSEYYLATSASNGDLRPVF